MYVTVVLEVRCAKGKSRLPTESELSYPANSSYPLFKALM